MDEVLLPNLLKEKPTNSEIKALEARVNKVLGANIHRVDTQCADKSLTGGSAGCELELLDSD